MGNYCEKSKRNGKGKEKNCLVAVRPLIANKRHAYIRHGFVTFDLDFSTSDWDFF